MLNLFQHLLIRRLRVKPAMTSAKKTVYNMEIFENNPRHAELVSASPDKKIAGQARNDECVKNSSESSDMNNLFFYNKINIMNHRIIELLNLGIILLFASCDMKTELDVDTASFPPKLCVTAILEGGNDGQGMFSIVLSEGRALADYKNPRPTGQKVIANGVIRLYEGDNLMVEHAGEFDMTTAEAKWDDDFSIMQPKSYGYRFETPVVTRAGSTYRIEVQAEGYATVTSTSAMPLLPDISVNIDTTVVKMITNGSIKEYQSLQYRESFYHGSIYGSYWPISLQWGRRESGRNYYALEMIRDTELIEGNYDEAYRFPWYLGKYNNGIMVDDLSKLQDNPEVEINDHQDFGFEEMRSYDLYRFPMLLMSDMAFTDADAALTAYVDYEHPSLINNRPDGWDDITPPPPDADGQQDKLVTHTVITLRVRCITAATFRYYRSLLLQNYGIGFFTEPVNIVGNIENGYGGFMVHSVREFTLLDYETYRMGY